MKICIPKYTKPGYSKLNELTLMHTNFDCCKLWRYYCTIKSVHVAAVLGHIKTVLLKNSRYRKDVEYQPNTNYSSNLLFSPNRSPINHKVNTEKQTTTYS